MDNDTTRNFDQASAFVADSFPPMWRRMYNNLIAEGFTDFEALGILKTYIISQGTGDKKS
jgi:hypothetical protein